MLVTLTAGPKPVVEAAAPALDAMWGRLAAHVNGAYANFLTAATEADVAAIYPTETFTRLAAVKRQYDPGNLFARNHNVRPSSSRLDSESNAVSELRDYIAIRFRCIIGPGGGAVKAVSMLHDDEADTSPEVVKALVAGRMPEMAGLPLARIARSGTENALYRLGDELLVRLPLTAGAARNVAREARWLEKLADALPLRIPEVVAVGEPDGTYPFSWLVQRWLPGADALHTPPRDLEEAADDLAALVHQLRAFGELPEPGGRGGPISVRAQAFDRALAQCEGLTDTAHARAVWEDALAAPLWDGPAVPLHADLIPSNLLVEEGRLSAVIDFGSLSCGDPAYDLIPAWFLLKARSRRRFLDAVEADEASVRRARGLVVSQSVIALPYYLHSNEIMAATARQGLAAVLAE